MINNTFWGYYFVVALCSETSTDDDEDDCVTRLLFFISLCLESFIMLHYLLTKKRFGTNNKHRASYWNFTVYLQISAH